VFSKGGNVFYRLPTVIMNIAGFMFAAWAEMWLLKQFIDNFHFKGFSSNMLCFFQALFQ
jgi:hypothetical protein